MKIMKLLTILIGLTVFSACTTTRYRTIHVPLAIPGNCNFEKFTPEEKNYLKAQEGQTIGKKINRNQKKCRVRQKRIETLVSKHNEAHHD